MFDVAVADDDEPVPVPERPLHAVHQGPAYPSPARHLRDSGARTASVLCVIEAATSTDPEIVGLWRKLQSSPQQLAWTAMATGVPACRRRMPKVAGDAELPGGCRVPGR